MSATKISTTSSRSVLDPDLQCRFTTTNGRRCGNPHYGSASGYCITHERLSQKKSATEARALAAELLQDCENVESFDSLLKSLSNLYRLVAQRRYSRMEGASLAYIGRTILRILALTEVVVEPEDDMVSDPNSGLEPGCIDLLAAWKRNANARAANPSTPPENSALPAEPAAQENPAATNPPPPQPAPKRTESPQLYAPEFGPRKAQTEFPVNEHPWGPAALTAGIRRCTPKYRGF